MRIHYSGIDFTKAARTASTSGPCSCRRMISAARWSVARSRDVYGESFL